MAEIIDAMFERDISAEIALEIPGLLGCVGDEPAAVIDVESESRSAVTEVVELITGIEVLRGNLAHGFEESPFGAQAEAKVLVSADLDVAKWKTPIGHRAADHRKVKDRQAEDVERGIVCN